MHENSLSSVSITESGVVHSTSSPATCKTIGMLCGCTDLKLRRQLSNRSLTSSEEGSMVTAQYGLMSAGRFCQHFTVSSPVPGPYRIKSGCALEITSSGGLQ